MIPSVDTYLRKEIEEKLRIILSNRYIIEEILKDIEPDIVDNFINAYFGDKGRDIPVLYTLPQEKVTQQGSIYIGLREGAETLNSVGNLEDIYSFKETGSIKEESVVELDTSTGRLYLEVNHTIGELINVENLMFSRSDNVEVDGKRIYFAYSEGLQGYKFYVNYIRTLSSKEEEERGVSADEQGLQKGFSATESYSIVSLSTNMDTVRCIDTILKAILVMMRENPDEQHERLLQRLQFGQLEAVDIDGNGGRGVPELLYGREIIVTYTVSYSLDVPFLNKLEEIIIKTNLK